MNSAPHRCPFCGAPSWLDPSEASMPADYCHPDNHGHPPVEPEQEQAA